MEDWVGPDLNDYDLDGHSRRPFPVHLAPGRGVYVFIKAWQGRAYWPHTGSMSLFGNEAFTLRLDVAGVSTKEIPLAFPTVSVLFRHPVITMTPPSSQSGPPWPDERRLVATPRVASR